ncbi:MAG: c-type cytochrome [Isosphaeraceae bacterium]|nr:c-type cytochrome [Isosphaeraceae bacterium]
MCIIAGAALSIGAGDPTPKVIAVRPTNPLEVRIDFDRPFDPGLPARMVGRFIAFGDSVVPGSEPSSSALSDPKDPTRGAIRIAAAIPLDDDRALRLVTDPHPIDTRYSLRIPTEPKSVDLVYDLSGVEVVWEEEVPDEATSRRFVWPSLDPRAAMERLGAIPETAEYAACATKPGRLTLSTMARLPKGRLTVLLRSNRPFEAVLFNEPVEVAAEGKRWSGRATIESSGEPIDLTLRIQTGTTEPIEVETLAATSPNSSETKVESSRLILPWAPSPPPPASASRPVAALYEGGDPTSGAKVFRSDAAKCATCHVYRGEGGKVGPALDELVGRERSWVYRQVAEPSATIQPRYVPYTVVTKDGRVAQGIVHAIGADRISVVDTEAKSTEFRREEIEELRPSSTSIMPVGLTGAIGEQAMRDLVAYLVTPPAAK